MSASEALSSPVHNNGCWFYWTGCACGCWCHAVQRNYEAGKKAAREAHDRDVRIATLVEAAGLVCGSCRMGVQVSMENAGDGLQPYHWRGVPSGWRPCKAGEIVKELWR